MLENGSPAPSPAQRALSFGYLDLRARAYLVPARFTLPKQDEVLVPIQREAAPQVASLAPAETATTIPDCLIRHQHFPVRVACR